jgi:hypothetical protein
MEANMAEENVKPFKIVEPESAAAEESAKPANPFENLDALRNPQDYEEFLGGEAVTTWAVRTLKEAMHLRVNPDPNYTLCGVYTVETKQSGIYFVYPQFRDALGPLPRRCNLHVAANGHGEYFLLRVKLPNPEQDNDNVWYQTARMVAAAAAKEWVKVTKPAGSDRGWGFIPVRHKMFVPQWTVKPFKEILAAAFPDHVIDRIDHDLIKQFEELGA